MKFGFDWPRGFKEFENNGCIHAFSPGQGQSTPGVNFFHKHKYSVNVVLCCKFSPLNDFATVFPFKRIDDPI